MEKMMDTKIEPTEDWYRYMSAMRRMQSGVAFLPDKSDQEPKHLRVGVNGAMVNADAFLHLLIDKGVITSEEFQKYLADSAEKEADRYEKLVQAALGPHVRLGEAGLGE